MLSPKRMTFRKAHRGRIKGKAERGSALSKGGDYALVALQGGRITSRQIEAARIAMTRKIQRGGNVWIRIFPDRPVTAKPAEVRMGSGKGAVDHYVALVKPGRILYEMGGGISAADAKEALMLAKAKLPIRTKLLIRALDPWC